MASDADILRVGIHHAPFCIKNQVSGVSGFDQYAGTSPRFPQGPLPARILSVISRKMPIEQGLPLYVKNLPMTSA